jgi:predicted solute-binding protein
MELSIMNLNISKRVIVKMKKNTQVDYNQHYESVLATEEDLEKVKASDFLHYFSDLIIKYSHQIELQLRSESEESI